MLLGQRNSSGSGGAVNREFIVLRDLCERAANRLRPCDFRFCHVRLHRRRFRAHGKDDFASKEEYKQMVLDTVQNAQGGDIVRNPGGRKGVTGFWNDSEGFVVWRDKNHPDQGTAFHPDQPDVYKKTWGFE
jgi:hypothetical protein